MKQTTLPLRNPLVIPEGTPQRECRSCQAPIYWIVTGNGKAMPLDPDGTSHFATCVNAAMHRKPRTKAR